MRGVRHLGALVITGLQVALAAITAYLGVLTVAAWRAIRRGEHLTETRATPTTRFLILVPAHDEERLIGKSLTSLGQLDYPASLHSVHVVADHCKDRTADIVREHGIDVHENDTAEHRGKGPALQWMLSRLQDRGEPHDAVVFVDADTLVQPNFLRVMDARLALGARVVQSYYAVREPESSPLVGFRAAALAVRHYLRPLGRMSMGGSSGLFGNGMVFAADVLRERSWTDHLTEDIELQIVLLLDGTSVDFAPDAVVAAEMPSTLEASRTQHERWEGGRLDLAKRFVPVLVRRAVAARGRRRLTLADAACDQLVPPFSVLAASSVIVGGLSFGVRGRSSLLRRGIAVMTLGTQAVHVLSGLRMVGAPRAVYAALLRAPLLVAWKVVLWLRVLVRPGTAAWIRTARNAEEEAA